VTAPKSASKSRPIHSDSAGPSGEALARIRAAAVALFSERGYDGVSMNEIAAGAGVSKANVFHHFSTKNALYLEVVGQACRHTPERLDELEDDSRPFGERLAHFAREHLATLLAEEQVSRLILRELLENGPRRGRELAEQVFGEQFARFVAILRAAQERGELRADADPAMIATLLIGADAFFFEARDVLRHFPDVGYADDPGRYSAMLADLLLHGIARRPAARGPNDSR
jgi:TetR/AcrR family transcriptional regulator